MKHNIFYFLVVLIFSQNLYSKCENQNLIIKAYISTQTLDLAYNNGSAYFKGNDRVEVFVKSSNQKKVYHSGTLSDDQAGSFKITAPSIINTELIFTHDHETSYFEGLYGNFINDSKIYDLSGIKCHWYELVEVYN